MGIAFELLVVFLLIVLNGVFSMSETAVVSARRARLQQRAEAGDDTAAAALELAQRPDRFLSTVQIGITLIGIIAGAFGGASLSQGVAVRLRTLGIEHNLSEKISFVLVVAFITYLSLVVGELVPKTLALNNAENIACRIARPMGMVSRFASPLVSFLSLSTRGVLRLMGVRPTPEAPVTEDEINILIAQGAKAGVFAEEEQEIVERVFRTADRRVSALMTPRREIVYLDVEDAWEENRLKIASAPHSAFPVCEGGLDNLLGVTLLKHIWQQGEAGGGAGGDSIDLRSTVRPAPYVLETTRSLKVLNAFKESRQNLVLVVDEYGNVLGMLTLHDVLEAMVGEVHGGGPVEDRAAVRREDGSWLLDGMLPADEFLHLLEVRSPPEDMDEYTSLGGFVLARLGRIPSVGEVFEWEGLRFEVLDMDGHRIDRVLVTPGTKQL